MFCPFPTSVRCKEIKGKLGMALLLTFEVAIQISEEAKSVIIRISASLVEGASGGREAGEGE